MESAGLPTFALRTLNVRISSRSLGSLSTDVQLQLLIVYAICNESLTILKHKTNVRHFKNLQNKTPKLATPKNLAG